MRERDMIPSKCMEHHPSWGFACFGFSVRSGFQLCLYLLHNAERANLDTGPGDVIIIHCQHWFLPTYIICLQTPNSIQKTSRTMTDKASDVKSITHWVN